MKKEIKHKCQQEFIAHNLNRSEVTIEETEYGEQITHTKLTYSQDAILYT
jgi:hypothetical protein